MQEKLSPLPPSLAEADPDDEEDEDDLSVPTIMLGAWSGWSADAPACAYWSGLTVHELLA